MKTARLGGFSAVLAILAIEGSASAFCRTTTIPISPDFQPSATKCWEEGLPLFWKNACVGYTIAEAASDQIAYELATTTIDDAFAKWSNATCPAASSGTNPSVSVKFMGGASCARVEYNQNSPNQNVIFFRDDAWPHTDSNNTLALTTVTFDTTTGEIYDADMEINSHDQTITTSATVPQDGYDFESIVTHETGHFLGLAHSGDVNATMFARYRPGSSQMRLLTSDDARGVCAIYPADGTRETSTGSVVADVCDPTPRHGFATDCSDTAASDDTVPSGGGSCSLGARPPTSTAHFPGWAAAAGLLFACTARRRGRSSP